VLADEDAFRWSSLQTGRTATLPVLLDDLVERVRSGERLAAGAALDELRPQPRADSLAVVDVPVSRTSGGVSTDGLLRLTLDCPGARVVRLATSWSEPIVAPEEPAVPAPETATVIGR
jgi:hypothetical protein